MAWRLGCPASVQSIDSRDHDASTGITTHVLVVVPSVHGSRFWRLNPQLFVPCPLRPLSVASIARGSWRCRGDHLVSSRCPPCPRRHSAWIGSLHLRVPVPRAPNRIIHAEIWEGVFRFAVRGTLHVSGSGQRSRVVAVQKLRSSKRAEEKEKASPRQRLSHPKLQHINNPLFSSIPSIASLNINTEAIPISINLRSVNHGSIIRPSLSIPNRSPNPPNRGESTLPSPVRFPGKSRPPGGVSGLYSPS